MKKSYLMIAAVAALFAACSNNDTFKEVDTQDAVIGFGHNATEKSTRAELDMAWFRESDNVGFGVYGFKSDAPIFTNENVVCSDENSPYAWSHTTIRFWDKAAKDAYDFYAYAPFTGTNNSATGANPTFTHTATSPSTTTGFTFTGLPVIVDITTDGADKAVATAVEDIDYDDTRLHGGHSNSPTVQFVFNHILSKLSFKIYTPVKPNNYATVADRVANFTVKSIKIDFPSAASVTWTETAKNDPAGTTTYNTWAAKTGTKADAAFETTVYSDATGTVVPYGETSAAAVAIGNTYIVTPVNSTVTKHEFDIQVIYDIEYADGTPETGCIATGTIGTGDPALNPGDTGYDANIYAPGQNDYYVAIIKLDPAKIEFCVENVNAWDPNGQELEEVEVK